MFTGLIEEIGEVKQVQHRGGARRFTITARDVLEDLAVDDSIAVSGVCLTVIHLSDTVFQVEAVEETLRKTTLGTLRSGGKVNLERSLRFSDRLGGHLVQGHVDGVGQITDVQPQKGGRLIAVALPPHLTKYVISKGSIAIDGVSLTVARLRENMAIISLIPHTLQKTTLGELNIGSKVNIEVDLIGKYIEKLLPHTEPQKFSEEWLQKMGFE
jgi:riboflavin synthase